MVCLALHGACSHSHTHPQTFYVIKYKAGEKYSPHLDPHDEPGSGPHSSRRIAAVVVNLSDMAAGGETIFPREGRDGAEGWSYRVCLWGLYRSRARLTKALVDCALTMFAVLCCAVF